MLGAKKLIRNLTFNLGGYGIIFRSEIFFLVNTRVRIFICFELTIDENEIKDIEFLYCSAHVLLGFFSKIEIET